MGLFWVVVGGGWFILEGGGWWWVIVGGGEWWSMVARFIKTLQSLCCKKRRIPIYLTKTALKRTSNAIFNMKKVDLDES